jgi:hypothetical protein
MVISEMVVEVIVSETCVEEPDEEEVFVVASSSFVPVCALAGE